jgi:hypothetical protein
VTPQSIVAVANNIHRELTRETEEPFLIENFEEELLAQLTEDSAKLCVEYTAPLTRNP